jgi:hypothetical protein
MQVTSLITQTRCQSRPPIRKPQLPAVNSKIEALAPRIRSVTPPQHPATRVLRLRLRDENTPPQIDSSLEEKASKKQKTSEILKQTLLKQYKQLAVQPQTVDAPFEEIPRQIFNQHKQLADTQPQNVDAQLNVGRFYARGVGVEIDVPQALVYHQKAAELGHAKAQFRVGSIIIWAHSTKKPVA